MKEDCVFCKIAKKEIPAAIVYEDKDIIAFNDIKPQAPVHVIVIPKRHIDRVSDLSNENTGLAGKLIIASNSIAREKGIVDGGYRMTINCNRDAGQEVFHMHIHVLGGRKMGWPPG